MSGLPCEISSGSGAFEASVDVAQCSFVGRGDTELAARDALGYLLRDNEWRILAAAVLDALTQGIGVGTNAPTSSTPPVVTTLIDYVKAWK